MVFYNFYDEPYDPNYSITNVQTILGVFDQDQEFVISLYLTRAANFVLDYCNLTTIPNGLIDVVEDLAVLKYRLMGVEGINSESKGSMTESYISSVPQDFISRLNKYRKLTFPS